MKTVQVLTPGDRATPPQVSDPYDQAEMDTSNPAVVGSESAEAADADVVPSKEAEDIDLLNNFLPRPPEAKCSDELQVSLVTLIDSSFYVILNGRLHLFFPLIHSKFAKLTYLSVVCISLSSCPSFLFSCRRR